VEEKKIHTRTRRKIKRLNHLISLDGPQIIQIIKKKKWRRSHHALASGTDENPTKTPKLGGHKHKHKHNDPRTPPLETPHAREAAKRRTEEANKIKPWRSRRSRQRDRSLNLSSTQRAAFIPSTKRGNARLCVFVVLDRAQ
jgi:hypothetical protein